MVTLILEARRQAQWREDKHDGAGSTKVPAQAQGPPQTLCQPGQSAMVRLSFLIEEHADRGASSAPSMPASSEEEEPEPEPEPVPGAIMDAPTSAP